MPWTLRDRVRLLLAGLAAGDSLGATSEFMELPQVRRAYDRWAPLGWPFVPVGGGSFNWRPGQPTDDTDMALGIVRSAARAALAAGHGSDGSGQGDGTGNGAPLDPADVAAEFCAWLATGPRDIGGTTRSALSAVARGTPWHAAGLDGYEWNPDNSANGGLMRNGVVAGLSDDLDACLRMTVWQSIVTHADPLSVLCCLAQTWLLHGLLANRAADQPPAFDGDGWLDAFGRRVEAWLAAEGDPHVVQWLTRVGQPRVWAAMDALRAADFSAGFDPFAPENRRIGQGYSVLTLQIGVWALRWALRNEPYAPVPDLLPPEPFARTGFGVIGWTALLGRDSDTYGATAGPLVAAAFGALPESMTGNLEALEEFDRVWPAGQ